MEVNAGRRKNSPDRSSQIRFQHIGVCNKRNVFKAAAQAGEPDSCAFQRTKNLKDILCRRNGELIRPNEQKMIHPGVRKSDVMTQKMICDHDQMGFAFRGRRDFREKRIRLQRNDAAKTVIRKLRFMKRKRAFTCAYSQLLKKAFKETAEHTDLICHIVPFGRQGAAPVVWRGRAAPCRLLSVRRAVLRSAMPAPYYATWPPAALSRTYISDIHIYKHNVQQF